MLLIRNGDVMLKEVKSFPDDLKKVDTMILAHGENGHCHTLVGDVEIFEDSNRIRYLSVKTKPAKVTHEEHKTIDIPVRKYVIQHEREFDPFAKEIRRVQD